MNIVFKCRWDNDLFQTLCRSGLTFPRYDTADQAIACAPDGAGLLILADDYPTPSDEIDQAMLDQAGEKNLRLYIEYPTRLDGLTLGRPQATQWERTVTSSDFFAPELESLTLLAQHGCWFLPTEARNPHLVAARVAGYHNAVFGLPENASPLLFELPGQNALVAVTKLSQFVTARYGPKQAWKTIWQKILAWVSGSNDLPDLGWTPAVDIRFGPDTPLPEGCEKDAFFRAAKWFREHIVVSTDWKKAAIEGYESIIDYKGRQFPRTWLRADCAGETALVLAYHWTITGNPDSRRLAGQILDYVFSAPDFLQNDPDTPAYGHVNWAEKLQVFYGDDNARVILPAMAAAKLLDDARWDKHILRCTLANFRTTGPLGFRMARLDYPASFTNGKNWEYYWNHEMTHFSPHFQAYLWGVNLWTYALTGHEELLTRTRTAIRMTMEKYPKLNWTNGLTQEMARLLLPLAFLVRLEDTPEHRQWLTRVANDLLEQMQPCGAIREMLGHLEDGKYPSPQSNDSYGTTEASLIQENGDPACDLLYTTNFAFLGLHEAAAATGDPKLQAAADKLADFLCRIQLTSTVHPHLDGGWMRAFDYELWEYFGSSADLGWGAWCLEAGWTNTWIASVLAMRHLGQSLFDLALSDRFKTILPDLLKEMFDPTKGKTVKTTGAQPVQAPGAE